MHVGREGSCLSCPSSCPSSSSLGPRKTNKRSTRQHWDVFHRISRSDTAIVLEQRSKRPLPLLHGQATEIDWRRKQQASSSLGSSHVPRGTRTRRGTSCLAAHHHGAPASRAACAVAQHTHTHSHTFLLPLSLSCTGSLPSSCFASSATVSRHPRSPNFLLPPALAIGCLTAHGCTAAEQTRDVRSTRVERATGAAQRFHCALVAIRRRGSTGRITARCRYKAATGG